MRKSTLPYGLIDPHRTSSSGVISTGASRRSSVRDTLSDRDPKPLCRDSHTLPAECRHGPVRRRRSRTQSRRLPRRGRRNPESSSDNPARPHQRSAPHHPDKRRISRGHTGLPRYGAPLFEGSRVESRIARIGKILNRLSDAALCDDSAVVNSPLRQSRWRCACPDARRRGIHPVFTIDPTGRSPRTAI